MKVTRKLAVSTLAVTAFALVAPVAASAATDTANSTISSAVGATISVSSTGTVNLNANPSGSGVQTTAKDTISVSTNNTAGYNLTVSATDATSALTSGGNTIAATTGTYASPAALVAGRWGYRVDGLGTFGAGPTAAASNAAIGAVTYAAVPANSSPQNIKSTSATATNDATDVWYSVAVNTAQATGTYTDAVVYTATTK